MIVSFNAERFVKHMIYHAFFPLSLPLAMYVHARSRASGRLPLC